MAELEMCFRCGQKEIIELNDFWACLFCGDTTKKTGGMFVFDDEEHATTTHGVNN